MVIHHLKNLKLNLPMASSLSRTLFLSWNLTQFLCLFLLLLLIGSCDATRPGGTMMPQGGPLKSEHFNHFPWKNEGLFFHVLPKGVPIPPSAPSKRHNSVADSLPPN